MVPQAGRKTGLLMVLTAGLCACQSTERRTASDPHLHGQKPSMRPVAATEGDSETLNRARPDGRPASFGLASSGPVGVDALLAVALERSPRVGVLRATGERSRARADQESLWPNPTLLGRLMEVPINDGNFGRGQKLVGLGQELPLGGRIGAARDVEQQVRSRNKTELELMRLELRAELAARVARTVSLRERATTLRRLKVELAELAELAARRKALGALKESLVLDIRLETERLALQLEQADAELLSTLSGFRATLGATPVPVDRLVDADRADRPLAPLNALALRPLLEGDNPHHRLHRERAEVARRRLDLELTRRYPDLGLQVLAGRSTDEDETLVAATVSLPLPIFDRNQGAIAAARAELRRSRRSASHHDLELAADFEIEIRARETARRRLEGLADRLEPAARRRQELARASWEAGHGELARVLNTWRELAAIRLEKHDARLAARLARARLTHLIGPLPSGS